MNISKYIAENQDLINIESALCGANGFVVLPLDAAENDIEHEISKPIPSQKRSFPEEVRSY